MPKSLLVQILHTTQHTSAKRAQLWVDREQAKWVTPRCIAFHKTIHFVDAPRHTDGVIDGVFEMRPRSSAGYMVMQFEHGRKR